MSPTVLAAPLPVMLIMRVAFLAGVLALTNSALGDYVARRGSDPGLAGDIAIVDDNGVVVRSATGAQHVVTWDRVREVTTNNPDLQRSIDEHREQATNLWRARSRLERGDTMLAEPLFERLFAQYRGRSHETALIVAEGLLRCRLARAANDSAIVPALEVARLRRKGVKSVSYDLLPRIFDEAAGLCTRLPPFWPSTSALARAEADLASYDAGGDTVVAAFAALYRAAAQRQLDRAAGEPAAMAEEQPGVALMRLVVNAAASEPEPRAAARAALVKRLAEMPEWAKAWAHFAIGDSLMRENGEGQQERGVVNLAHLPASYAGSQPYLTALALARMAAATARLGDASAAAALRAEFERLYPNHPAAQVLEAAGRPATAAQTAAGSVDSLSERSSC